MSIPLEYPPQLPAPKAAPITAGERRARSPDGAPLAFRAVQRDRIARQDLVWPPMTPDEAGAFMDWGEGQLVSWGAAFSASSPSWPLPDGMGAGVRRFMRPPAATFIAGGYWRFTAETEVRGRGMLPVDQYLRCDLYLKGDEANAALWRDFSNNRRAIALHENDGTIEGSTVGAAFGRGLEFNQAAPGGRAEQFYGAHSWLEAAGNIVFGADDWIIDFTSTIPADTDLANTYGMCVIDNINNAANPDGTGTAGGGFYVWFIPYESNTRLTLVFSAPSDDGINQREIHITNCENDFGTLTRYTFSRKGRALTSLRNGVIVEQVSTAFAVDEGLQPRTRGFIRIGCSHQNEAGTFAVNAPSAPQLIDGYNGTLDEIYIAHGPGAGVDAAFDLPTEPRT